MYLINILLWLSIIQLYRVVVINYYTNVLFLDNIVLTNVKIWMKPTAKYSKKSFKTTMLMKGLFLDATKHNRNPFP